jgi:hypothetical protein
VLGQEDGGEARRDRKCRDQRANERITIGARHRAEDLSLDALHCEQRDERRHDDRGGKEHRLVDLQRADQDQAQPIRPGLIVGAGGRACRIGSPSTFRELREQGYALFRPRLEIAVDILHQDDSAVDDDAEIDGADRQQVRVLVAHDQDDDAEKQRERDVRTHDDGTAQIAEKNPLNEEDQEAPENQVMQDRAGRDRDERGAIIEWDELHSGRQTAIAVDLVHCCPHARDHVVRVQRTVHDDDGRHHVVLLVASGFAEARNVPNVDLGHVLDEDRNTFRLGEENVLDVLDAIALRQIGGAPAIHQADAANVDGLLADIDGAAAHIVVGVADRADHLGERDVVGVELIEIDFDLILLRSAAPGIDLHDPGHRKQAALQHPILHGAQVGQPEMGRTHHLITINLADEARALDLRRDIVRKIDVLLQIYRRLLQSEVVIDPVLKHDAHEGQAVERGGPDHVDAWRSGQPDLEGDGIVALHLLGGLPRGLRRNLQDDGRGIGVSLDV